MYGMYQGYIGHHSHCHSFGGRRVNDDVTRKKSWSMNASRITHILNNETQWILSGVSITIIVFHDCNSLNENQITIKSSHDEKYSSIITLSQMCVVCTYQIIREIGCSRWHLLTNHLLDPPLCLLLSHQKLVGSLFGNRNIDIHILVTLQWSVLRFIAARNCLCQIVAAMAHQFDWVSKDGSILTE